MRVRGMVLSAVLVAGGMLAPLTLHAQQNIQPSGAAKDNVAEVPANNLSAANKEQLLTATVHQAWELSGKDEEKFFDMVQQCAEISAMNRGIQLPDSQAAGVRMGNYIKTSAKSDTNQLLFAVVDKAVVMTSHVPVHKAGTAAKK